MIKLEKKALHVVAALVGCLLFLSCGGDQNFDDPNNPTLDGTAANVQNMITGMEAGLRIDVDFYYQVVSIIGRDAYYFQTADPRYTGELLKGPIDAGGFLVQRTWASRYAVIRNGNLLMERLPDFGLSGTQESGARGVAKTFQAYQFLLNLNFTHNNGIRTDVAGELPGPWVSLAEGQAFIADLLDEAHADLQAGGDSFAFGLTTGFAGFDSPATFATFNRGLKARVEAYRGNWQSCLDALAESFIDSAEGADMYTGTYHVFGSAAGDVLNWAFDNQSANNILWLAHPSTKTDAEAGDLRYTNKINERSNVNRLDGLESNLGITIAALNTSPFTIMRNEELLLLRAEANINLGNLTDGEADLNVVRAAAGLEGVVLSNMNDGINQMLFERRYSLFLEGHRWIDTRRYNHFPDLPLDRGDDGRGPDIIIPEMPRPANEF